MDLNKLIDIKRKTLKLCFKINNHLFLIKVLSQVKNLKYSIIIHK
jgi:hypothetical protein